MLINKRWENIKENKQTNTWLHPDAFLQIKVKIEAARIKYEHQDDN